MRNNPLQKKGYFLLIGNIQIIVTGSSRATTYLMMMTKNTGSVVALTERDGLMVLVVTMR